jgi:hypothetical protein
MQPGEPTPQARPKPNQRPIGQRRWRGVAPQARARPGHDRAPASAAWAHLQRGGSINREEDGVGVDPGTIPLELTKPPPI